MLVKIQCVYFDQYGRWAGEGRKFIDTDRNPDIFPGCMTPRDYGFRLRALGLLPNVRCGVWHHPFAIRIRLISSDFDPDDCLDYQELVTTQDPHQKPRKKGKVKKK